MRRREFLKTAVVPLAATIPVASAFRLREASASARASARPAVASAEAVGPKIFRLKPEARDAPSQVTIASSFDPWVEINAANLRHNVAEISRRVGGRPILAVIKNNGYGTGVANIARLLEPIPAISGLAVVKLQEAVAVRDARVKKPLLLMGPFDERDLEEALALDVTPMVYLPIGDTLDRLASKLQRPVSIQICVDTGIGRVGVPYRVAAPLIEDLARRRSVRIIGVMMTFAEHPEFDKEQLARFTTLCSDLEAKGITLGRRHAASSFGLFHPSTKLRVPRAQVEGQHPDGFLDMVRPGMAVYGVYSEAPFRTSGIMQLRPAVALRCRVAYVKQLHKGDSAGYERAYIASRDTWVATLPVGHADGWPRAAAGGGPAGKQAAKVKIGSQLYPVVASVSASHTIVEIGAGPRVKVGDVATLFDWEEGSRPEDVAAACGASVYDLLMHLGGGLTRRIVA